MPRHAPRRFGAASAAAVTAAMVGVGLTALPAHAATSVTDASFEWGVSGVQQGGAAAGGCDYFTAGQTDGSLRNYASKVGDVAIMKKQTDGTSVQATSGTRCDKTGPDGTIGQRMLFSAGEGNVEDNGAATIEWTGSATVNSYGGMVPWYIQDPELKVDAAGNGTITATVGGYSSSQDDPDVKEPLEPESGVTIAELKGVEVTEDGFTATPEFQGADYFPLNDPDDASKGRSKTSAITDKVKAKNPEWGAWPESFVDFQYRTGLSTYWHTSGASADPDKLPEPVSVELDHQADGAPTVSKDPADRTVSSGTDVKFAADVDGEPEPSLQWQSSSDQGKTWSDIEAATSSELEIDDVTVKEHDGLRVRLVATNEFGTVITDPAELTVEEQKAVEITAQPEDVEAPVGSNQYLSVKATGSALSYTWQRSTDGGKTWEEYAGAGDDWGPNWLTVPAKDVTLDNDGDQFRVVVSNGADDSVTSEAATMKVTTSAPRISWQPETLTVYKGMPVDLTGTVTAAPKPNITWERSADGGKTWTEFAKLKSASTPTHRFKAAAENDGDQFRFRADNGIGDPAESGVIKLKVIDEDERAVTPVYGSPLDPEGDGRLQVIGTGFDLKKEDADKDEWVYLDIVEKGTRPTQEPIAEKDSLGRSSIHFTTFDETDGYLTANVHFDKSALDPSKRYELVIYNGDDLDNDGYDYVLPLLVKGQEPLETEDPDESADPSEDPSDETTTGPSENPATDPSDNPSDDASSDPTDGSANSTDETEQSGTSPADQGGSGADSTEGGAKGAQAGPGQAGPEQAEAEQASAGQGEGLSTTGATAMPAIVVGAVVVLAGLGMVFVARTRRRH